MIIQRTVLVAAAVSVVLLAAACGGDDGEATAPTPPPATGAPAPPPADTAVPESPPATEAPPADTAAPDEDAVELSQAGGRLADVLARGSVRCGVRDALPGFSFLTPEGEHEGFDSDFCRVIAAAVLGDAGAVDFVDLATADRFTALQSGEIDVLVRNTTFTASRDGKEGANFVYTTLYDGQGVMVPASTGIRTAGQCEAFTSDKSGLAVFKFEIENGGGDEQFILSETISKEPLGPAVLDGDTEWAQVRKHAAGRRPAQLDARARRRRSCRSGGGGGGWWR